MQSAKVYQNQGMWFVDYIDSNYELLPAVGVFKTKEQADAAARSWSEDEKVMENLG